MSHMTREQLAQAIAFIDATIDSRPNVGVFDIAITEDGRLVIDGLDENDERVGVWHGPDRDPSLKWGWR